MMSVMNKAEIAFTRFNSPGVAKTYEIEEGQLVKKAAANFITGTFETVTVGSIGEFKDYLEERRPGDFLTSGVNKKVKHGQCGLGAFDIHRTKEEFPFTDGKPGLVIIDSDNINKLGLPDISSYANALEQLLGDADYALSPSASSGITYKGVVGATKGIHAFVFIQDAGLIPIALEALHKRSVILGYAWPLVTKDGKIMIRSLVDTAMQTSNQPCYEGGAILGTGITQEREVLCTRAGGEVSFLQVSPLTLDEEYMFSAEVKKLSATVAIEADTVRTEWMSGRLSKMVVKGCSPENAKLILDAAMSGDKPILSGDFEIQTDKHGVLTVREILAERIKYHEATCHDPLDPENGAGKAKIYSNNSGSPAVHSFAHGGATYILQSDNISTLTAISHHQTQTTTLTYAALDVVDRTDAGNVAVLANITKGDLRYILENKTFMVWEGERWRMDYGSVRAHQLSLGVAEQSIQLANYYWNEAKRQNLSKEEIEVLENQGDYYYSWAAKCRSKTKLDAVLALAQRDPRFVVQASNLDRDPFLLGVANGTIDLRNGQLRPNSRADFVTKRCPIDFNTDAKAPRWEQFISEITSVNGSLVAGVLKRTERKHLGLYLKKLLGYCFTGDTREQVMFILIGGGSNGKNVLLDTFKAIGGDYIETIAPEVLMTAKFDNGADQASPSTRKLAGARAAISSESKEGQKLDISVVKRHTGGGYITARGLHKDPVTFEITHKLLLMTNTAPSIAHMDDATRGRLHMIPFDMKWNRPSEACPDPTFPNAQKNLMEVLEKEREGILLWLVQGAAAYYKEGLSPPSEVVAKTATYLDSNDSFKQWYQVYEKCMPSDGTWASALYVEYTQLCRDEALSIQITSTAELGKKLKTLGCEHHKFREGMKYGLRKKCLGGCPPNFEATSLLSEWATESSATVSRVNV